MDAVDADDESINDEISKALTMVIEYEIYY